MLNFAIPDPKLAAPMLRVRGDGVGLHVRVIATVNATSLTTAPSIYTVQNASETLQSIAKTVWGDSKLWYLIADANAIGTDSAPLTAGQLIKLPARINTINNNAQTFKPYDPSKLIGATTPNLPQVPAVECGGYGQVITTVVAIVVTAVVTVYSLGTGTGAALAAFEGAAAGNIAGQVVGNAIGVQDGFSFKSLALAVVSAEVGGAVPGASELGSGVTGAIAHAAIANAVTQGIGVVTGLQRSFDWRGVVASGIGAGVSTGVGSLLEAGGILQGGDFGSKFARGAVTGFAGGLATAAARGGKVSVVQVAVDSFGNALGNAIAGNISNNIVADRQTFGATFTDDAAARRAQNPLLGRTTADSGGYLAQGDQNAFNDGLTPGQRDFLDNSTAGPGGGIAQARQSDLLPEGSRSGIKLDYKDDVRQLLNDPEFADVGLPSNGAVFSGRPFIGNEDPNFDSRGQQASYTFNDTDPLGNITGGQSEINYIPGPSEAAREAATLNAALQNDRPKAQREIANGITIGGLNFFAGPAGQVTNGLSGPYAYLQVGNGGDNDSTFSHSEGLLAGASDTTRAAAGLTEKGLTLGTLGAVAFRGFGAVRALQLEGIASNELAQINKLITVDPATGLNTYVSGGDITNAELTRLSLDGYNKTGTPIYRTGEGLAASEFEKTFGVTLERITKETSNVKNPADFTIRGGELDGKTIDFLYTINNEYAKDKLNANFLLKIRDENAAYDNLVKHVNKADFVPLDFRTLNEANQSKLLNNVIPRLTPAQQAQLLIIKGR
jgi:hypothetical protein